MTESTKMPFPNTESPAPPASVDSPPLAASDNLQTEQQPLPSGEASPTKDQTPLPKDEEEPEKTPVTSTNDPAQDETSAPEDVPPLPPGPPPEVSTPDDGWQPVWDESYQAYYFYNTLTHETTWTNPRVPDATPATLPQSAPPPTNSDLNPDLHYNPAIHGDYDPSAPYAQAREAREAAADDYTAMAKFNRFTGKFQAPDSKLTPENYNDENKSKRQMQFYFDVDAAANSHDGKSLKAERQTKKLSKRELKEFKAKRKEKKEMKRRAWLKD